jgi:hypothetical protein
MMLCFNAHLSSQLTDVPKMMHHSPFCDGVGGGARVCMCVCVRVRLCACEVPCSVCSSGCNKIMQWDLSRSVPRKVNEVSVYTGDIQGLVTGGGRLYSCGADGSIRSWQVGKKGELTPLAAREKAHKERVSAILYKSVSPVWSREMALKCQAISR